MAVPSFLTKNGTSDFLSKQKNLFDILDAVEKEKGPANSCDQSMEVSNNKSPKRQRKITKQFRGKESLFHEPVDLPLRFKKANRIPDFQRNPHKWTKYGLGDVTQEQMSNESNTAAAMSFLRDIKLQKMQAVDKKEQQDTIEGDTHQPNSHKFNLKKESCINETVFNNDEDKSHKSYFRGSKYVMAEYVIGQSKKSDKSRKRKLDGEKGKEIFLSHLCEYEDD